MAAKLNSPVIMNVRSSVTMILKRLLPMKYLLKKPESGLASLDVACQLLLNPSMKL
nr:MAG: hypothetical protein J07AB56_12110 [Candidatus Nanosalinarum sp. J07AB56]